MAFDINTAVPEAETKSSGKFDITTAKPVSNEATEDQYLRGMERIKPGFAIDPTKERQRLATEKGLAADTPLEPTGFNIRNIADFPMDVAEMLGQAFPVLGAIGGGIAGGGTTGGVGAIASASAGAGAMELARQQIGESIFGYDQGSATGRIGKGLMEAGFAALGEGAGQGINMALKATKRGLINAGNTLLKKRGMDSFVKHFAKIARGTDANVIKFAQQDLRAGSNATISNLYSSEDFGVKFFNKLFQPKGDFALRMSKLGKPIKSRAEFRDLYGRLFGLGDDVFDTVVTNGASKVKSASNPNVVKNLAKNIDKQLPEMFNKLGSKLSTAREELAKRADKVTGVSDFVSKSLTEINSVVADDLAKIQMLVPESNGMYSFNKDFIRTSTGRSQFNIFKNFIADFMEGADTLSQQGLQKLVNSGEMTGMEFAEFLSKRNILFSPAKKTTFKQFSNSLRKLDVQISGKEFTSVGEMSSTLAKYVKGLRSITSSVADNLGDSRVSGLSKAYGQLAQTVKDIRGKDVSTIEQALRKMTNAKIGTQALEDTQALNSFIKNNFGVDVNKQLNLFKANQTLSEMQRTFGMEKGQQALSNIMRKAFSEEHANMLYMLENSVDKYLPNDLKIALNARRHTAARVITKDAESLLKARFLSNALLAGTGFAAGGPGGAMAGLGAGLALQRPEVLRGLLSLSSKYGGKVIPQTAARQLPSGASQILTQLVKGQGNNNNI